MQRLKVEARNDWRQTAETHGFQFHTIEGKPYWDETACYSFSLEEIERDLEAPANELEQMCLSLVEEVARDASLMERLQIPPAAWDLVAESWRKREKNLYGRMDFAYAGTGPAKLYEYNADTPTALFESAIFQWVWLEQAMQRGIIAKGADQFNSLHERLLDAFTRFGIKGPLHFAAVKGSTEDMGTIAYLADCAGQAGLKTATIAIEDIGISKSGRFTDLDDRAITTLFKLYPWEWLLREDYARFIPASQCQFIEPAWKSILSNKGMLALLWQRFPGHPNLLATYFEGDPAAAAVGPRHVRKPLYSREGANVELIGIAGADANARADGPYGAEGHVVQSFHPLPEFNGSRALCGVWLIASEAAGLGIREDAGLVTTNEARFVPHLIR